MIYYYGDSIMYYLLTIRALENWIWQGGVNNKIEYVLGGSFVFLFFLGILHEKVAICITFKNGQALNR